jgi:hypothetical protein
MRAKTTKRKCGMKLCELPLDTWVVVEPVSADEVKLLSEHNTQHQAEAECSRRNKGRDKPRCQALKALEPIPSAQACAAVVTHKR